MIKNRTLRLICSGNCPYFETAYRAGRKVAGRGVCDKKQCGAAVQVGNPCMWSDGEHLTHSHDLPDIIA